MKRICRFLMIIWMIVIFSFSAQDGKTSDGTSMKVGRVVGEMKYSDFEQWTETEQYSFIYNVNRPIRKTAHFCEYFVLGVLVFLSLSGGWAIWWRLAAAEGVAVLYAISDELHQLLSFGRTCQAFDVAIDGCGAFAGILAMGGVIFIYRKVMQKSNCG